MEEQTSNSRGKNNCEAKSLLLSDLSYLLILRDQVGSDLRQATALMLVTENDEFVQCDPCVLQDYLYAARGFVVDTKRSYECLDSHLSHLSRRIKAYLELVK